MSSNAKNGFDRRLMTVTQQCAEEVELHGLVRSVGEALADVPNLCTAGVAVFDDERQAVQRYTVMLTPASAASPQGTKVMIGEEEFPLAETEIASLLDGSSLTVVDLQREHRTSLGDRLRAGGCRHYVSASIMLRGKLLGALFVASSHHQKIPDSVVAGVKDLAKVVTPILCNCLNHIRFARGDRRRDVLIELSNVVNSSLELDTVLTHAGRVLGSLDGHRMSAICLLNEGNRTYRSHQIHGAAGTARVSMPEPTVHRVKGSILAWLLEHGSNYESEDLESVCQYEEERDFRKNGVRRYLAIPLLARGRILGGLMFGTPDPYPRRKIEYWLYENIAMQLALAIDNAIKHEQLQRLTQQLTNQNAYLQTELKTQQGFGEMIGNSSIMESVRANILRVAATDTTVLITGETGVGKELVARNLHEHSGRSGQPFIKVNCPSIPEGMVESELFGHERGAFTSAVERRIGRFELARDGTLFLDEIGEVSPALQAKLLRVLQDGEFERVGGSKTLSTNARIIAATNCNLEKAIQDSKFRPDLYYRLNVFPIHVPPLRSRPEDIPALVEAFLFEFSQRFGKRLDKVDDASLAELCKRTWPGNIRQLRHVLERAAILANGPIVQVEAAPTDEVGVVPGGEGASPSGLHSLDAVQAEHIRRTLKTCGGQIEGAKGAAALLGIKPSTLRFRMKRLGIERC